MSNVSITVYLEDNLQIALMTNYVRASFSEPSVELYYDLMITGEELFSAVGQVVMNEQILKILGEEVLRQEILQQREQAMQELADQAQELDLGYE